MYRIRGKHAIEQQLAQTGVYVDPLGQVPHVDEPDIDTQFVTGPSITVKMQRAEYLVTLAELEIIQNGASKFTDHWLALARQNVYATSLELSQQEQSRMAVLGLTALYLDSDIRLRENGEAYVMSSRANNVVRSGAWNETVLKVENDLATLEALDNGEINFDDYLAKLTEGLGAIDAKPVFAQVKSHALFNYASTMADCDEKRDLLKEALLYANHAFSTASDMATKGKALRILASALHDISYMANPFGSDAKINAELVPEARNYAVTLLHTSVEELEFAIQGGQDPTGLQPVLNEARYFENLYAGHVQEQGIYTPQTPEIREHVTREAAKKFGTKAIMYALPAPDEAQPEAA